MLKIKRDLLLLMHLVKNIDIEYGNAKMAFIHDFVHFKKFVKDWNLKYPDLTIAYYTERKIDLPLQS